MYFIDIDINNFNEEVLHTPTPVVVVFYAVWSGCSHITELIIEELNLDAFPAVKFCRINAEENKEIVEEYGIRTIPTVLFFYQKQIVDCIEGTFPKSNIIGKLRIVQKRYEKNHKNHPDYDIYKL